MNLWKVKIRGVYTTGNPGMGGEIRRQLFRVLLEAESADDAFQKGSDWINGNAPMSIYWREFTVLEAAPVRTPLIIDELL